MGFMDKMWKRRTVETNVEPIGKIVPDTLPIDDTVVFAGNITNRGNITTPIISVDTKTVESEDNIVNDYMISIEDDDINNFDDAEVINENGISNSDGTIEGFIDDTSDIDIEDGEDAENIDETNISDSKTVETADNADGDDSSNNSSSDNSLSTDESKDSKTVEDSKNTATEGTSKDFVESDSVTTENNDRGNDNISDKNETSENEGILNTPVVEKDGSEAEKSENQGLETEILDISEASNDNSVAEINNIDDNAENKISESTLTEPVAIEIGPEIVPETDIMNEVETKTKTVSVEHETLSAKFCNMPISERKQFLTDIIGEFDELMIYLSEFVDKAENKKAELSEGVNSLYKRIATCQLSEATEIVGKIQEYSRLYADIEDLVNYINNIVDV